MRVLEEVENMVTAVLIGAGLRGEVYSSYALEHPDEFKVVAVAEPNAHVREVFAEKYQIADEMLKYLIA